MILILVVQTRDLQSGGIHGIYNNLHFDTSGKEKFENTQNHYLENTFGFKDKTTWFDSDFVGKKTVLKDTVLSEPQTLRTFKQRQTLNRVLKTRDIKLDGPKSEIIRLLN